MLFDRIFPFEILNPSPKCADKISKNCPFEAAILRNKSQDTGLLIREIAG